jgi:arylsulfatase A-like enzyme
VANLDIMPTVLDYLGIPHDGLPLSGRSLRSLIEGTDRQLRVVFSDQGKWRSADDGRFKLMLDAAEMVPALFDLRLDPLELTDVHDSAPGIGHQLRPELERWLIATEGGVGSSTALKAGQQAEERLRALGYIQ